MRRWHGVAGERAPQAVRKDPFRSIPIGFVMSMEMLRTIQEPAEACRQ
jgi:hypothetical protein